MEVKMAGGIGSGFFVVARCACCPFESCMETENTPSDIEKVKEILRKMREEMSKKFILKGWLEV